MLLAQFAPSDDDDGMPTSNVATQLPMMPSNMAMQIPMGPSNMAMQIPGATSNVATQVPPGLSNTVARWRATRSNAPGFPGSGQSVLPYGVRHLAPGMRMPRVPQHLRRMRHHPALYQKYLEYGKGLHDALGATYYAERYDGAPQFVAADLSELEKTGLVPKTSWWAKYGPATLMAAGATLMGVGAVVGYRRMRYA